MSKTGVNRTEVPHHLRIWECPLGEGGGTPILGHGREVLLWWPPFLGYSIRLGPYFIPHFSPSHLVHLGHKVYLIFHQNVLFNRFKAFCINFPFNFYPIDPLFHWFYIFLTPHFHKTLHLIEFNFIFCMLNLDTKIWWSIPPPQGGPTTGCTSHWGPPYGSFGKYRSLWELAGFGGS